MTIETYIGDCLDVMPLLPANSVDLVLADLPYGLTQNRWDSVIPLDRLWAAYRRLCKPRTAIVLMASQPFTSMLVMSQIGWFRHEWIWRKNKATGHLNARKAPMKAHESVLVFAQGAYTYHPQFTDNHRPGNAYYTAHNGSNYGAQVRRIGGGSTQRYPRSVQDFAIINNDNPEKTHPTQKPVALMEYLIKTYSNEGDTVLDNAMGSGTVGVACARLNRSFIGIEKNTTYYTIAFSRINTVVLQPNVVV